MAQLNEENLLNAIKKDDLKAFDALMDTTQCGSYRLGRFPVLSLLYLYKSRKILSAYEDKFLQITTYKALRESADVSKSLNVKDFGEPLEVSKKFSAKAGKCLRLYFNEVVSPLEMLLILDKTKHLKDVYPMTNLSSEIKERLKSIYYIKYSLNIKFEVGKIVIDRRPLSYREKKRIATICLSVVLVIAIIVTSSVISSVFAPVRLDKYFDLTAYETYTLDQDLYVPKNCSIEEVNCTLIGNGHKLIFQKGATIKTFNGNMSDLTIESSGKAIFTLISESAKIENVTFNVNANLSTSEATAFVALTNYGVIENVTVNASGRIKALATTTEVTEELNFAGLVLQNYVRNSNAAGTVKNCVVNYSQFSLVGEASANAVFGGVAGINNGYLQDCKVTGQIVADTFDIAGVCSLNSGLLSGNVNQADLSQTSADAGWNPIVCGIVSRNTYVVEDCHNLGRLSAVSNCDKIEQDSKLPTVSVAGIAYLNNNTIGGCKNSGSITAVGKGEAYVGGISAHSYARITDCLSSGDITVTADSIYAGGILGYSEIYYTLTLTGYSFAWGDTLNCISQNKINVTAIGDGVACVGGTVGYVDEVGIELQSGQLYFGGGVTGSYFVGEIASNVNYFGNIVGVCAKNIYENNSYTLNNDIEYHNFDSNYYLSNSSSAFGAAVTDEGDYSSAEEDKGATSATIEVIQNLEAYKSILKKFN
ncbi:MAG: hypothetical protein K2G42_00520 [Clostridia bacterium]|nr:hypothetical protein [Clostridia bacterium]